MTQSETPQTPYSPQGEPFDGAGAPQPPSKAKKWLRAGGAVVVAGVAAASWAGLGGAGEPEMGDCIKDAGESSFEVVDCGGADAQYKVVGVEEESYTLADYEADDTLCAAFASTEVVLWSGDEFGTKGTVYCAEPA